MTNDAQHLTLDQRFVVMGVSGVGKSLIGELFARTLGIPFLEGDALHPPENVARMAAGIALTDADRAGWLQDIANHLSAALARREGLVVACSALRVRYRDVLRSGDPEATFIFLTGQRSIIAGRMAHRPGHFMPTSLLDSQLETLEPPMPNERAWACDIAASPAAIVADLVARVQAESKGQHQP